MPSRSITLLAFGRRGYGLAAHNAILSLRHHGYNGPIDLFITDTLTSLVPSIEGVTVHPIQDADPGYLKLELPDLIKRPTLYIDVDSLAIADVTPLLDALEADGRFLITSVQGKGTSKSTSIGYFGWAKPAKVAQKEGFADDATMYGIQSSWMWMVPCAALSAIGDRARASYLRWDKGEFAEWGGSKPDELFLSIACTDLKHDPSWTDEPMWFGSGIVCPYDHQREARTYHPARSKATDTSAGIADIRPRIAQGGWPQIRLHLRRQTLKLQEPWHADHAAVIADPNNALFSHVR